MCCIFTCCGWMVDLIQRLWTFTMSCCISSAVCCSLVTASMSGVALGYNYSLAEYIDLKETNVSVYLKRGIFDDEIADDMDWRRSGRQPIAGHIGENNLLTASDESSSLRSGRRLDDSIYESNDRNNFEGSLMRLTAKVPDPSTSESTSEVALSELIKQYPSGSLDQLKAVQSAINMRKAAAAVLRTNNKDQETPFINEKLERKFSAGDDNRRRAMKFDVPPFDHLSSISSLREAVPDNRINDPSKWMLPKLPPQMIPKDMLYIDDYHSPTYPSPITPRAGPIRPSRPKPLRPKSISTGKPSPPTRSSEPSLLKSIDEEMDSFKGKLIVDRLNSPGMSEDEFLKKIKMGIKKSEEDYEEEIKGVPLRRKRSNKFFLNNLNPNADDSKKLKVDFPSSNQDKDNLATGITDSTKISQHVLIKLLFSSRFS